MAKDIKTCLKNIIKRASLYYWFTDDALLSFLYCLNSGHTVIHSFLRPRVCLGCEAIIRMNKNDRPFAVCGPKDVVIQPNITRNG